MNTSDGWGGLEMNMLNLAEQMKSTEFKITLISQEGSTILEKGSAHFVDRILINKRKKYFDFKVAKDLAKN